ncbi:MAG: cation transporter [Alphaproteobacteria bacterium]|nr:cation transporter [Alphaproteobacteria bacterium]MBV9199712.1 cation transporter [Alphaproteobacteria bacterium]
MSHDHQSHTHGGHGHLSANYGRAFAIGISLNLAYVAGEAIAGIVSGSLALLADAGHNLGDVLGLGMSWGAAVLGRRQPSGRFTYGLRSSSILAALANAIILLVVTGGIAWEAILRITNPVPVASGIVIAVAAAGIFINGGTAMLFASGSADLNIRSAFLHLAADALVTAGVVVTGVAIWSTHWLWLDPAVSLVVSAVIVFGTWGLLKSAIGLALNAVPEGIDAAAVRSHLLALPGVTGLHDLHIWGMSTTETALTCHLIMPDGHPGDGMLSAITQQLHHRFGIEHATIQIELADTDEACALTPEHVV